MDKRTIEGKTFQALETNEEKQLFLLEKLYDKLNDIECQESHRQLANRRLLELQTKCLVFLVQSTNTNTQACEKYRQYLEKELQKIADQPFSWGSGKKW